ncbi:putative protein disulfide-isomerase [Besnoitia besnoiti]|uniref:Thioredoxin domain-containing protein n=1 Tax=Besnoitia besnoiti TaxID=94643 RepID=A0A2A9MHL9_BESBE|nr:putative protein disulfide-isomerase [Besnoitia besnoiti]PFH37475.1 putative protein disulfide-isomerase [Besnoitia besnoiti]
MAWFPLVTSSSVHVYILLAFVFAYIVSGDPGASGGNSAASEAPLPEANRSSTGLPIPRLISRAGDAAKALKLTQEQQDTVKRNQHDTGTRRPYVSGPLNNLGDCASEYGCRNGGASATKRKPEMLSTAVMSRGAVSLADDNYHDFLSAHSIALVLYYAPWCSWSQKTSPEFDAAARVLAHDKGDPPVFLAKVDCTQHTQVMRDEDIQEYPTLKFFVEGHPREYTGGRKRAEILKWLQENLNRDRMITSVNALEEVLANRQLGTLVVIAAQDIARPSSPEDGGALPPSPLLHPAVEQPAEAANNTATTERTLRRGVASAGNAQDATSGGGKTVAGAHASVSPYGAPTPRVRAAGRNAKVDLDKNPTTPVSAATSLHASKKFHRETFVKVSRMMGNDVLFGEIADPEVLEYYLDVHVKPYMKTRLDMAHIHLPFIAAFPSESDKELFEDRPLPLVPDEGGEEVVVYTGSFSDEANLTRFVQTHKFPPAFPFTGIVAPRIFEDGRPICVMFLDNSGARKRNSQIPVERAPGIRQAFEDVASKYRSQIIFTVSGTKEPHERRLLTLLGVEDERQTPQLRIVTFNPSGNGKYYPALKFKPANAFLGDKEGSLSMREAVSADRNINTKDNSEEAKHVSDLQAKAGLRSPRIPSAGEPTALESESRKEGLRGSRMSSETNDAGLLQAFKGHLTNFVTSYLDGSLTPYLRSEPVPAEEENNGVLKVVVGSTFNEIVLQNDRDVLVEFGAPWCGHCRKVEPTLKMIAAVLQDSGSTALVAKMDATRNEVKDLYFTGYPTLLLFPASRKTEPIMYQGDRSEDDLLQWLASNVDKNDIDLDACRAKVKKLLEQQALLISGPISESGEPLIASRGTMSQAERSVLEEL